MTDTRADLRRGTDRAPVSTRPTTATATGRGFRPGHRRRSRIALGVLLAAIAVGGNALVYSNLDQAEPAVQVVSDVPAGALITDDLLRTVDVDADPTVNLVHGDDLATLVGQYAKVRLVSGSLIVADAVQTVPLVSPDAAVVALQVADGSLPSGLRERAPVALVIAGRDENEAPTSIDGRVVGLPRETSAALGLQSLSVEVARADAPLVAAADDVRVVLLEPAADPADQTPEPGG